MKVTTGLAGLDRVFHGVMPGDNIVWQVESIDDYKALVMPYAEATRREGGHLIYFRFAEHPPLLPDDFGAEIHAVDPNLGFESFVRKVHAVIEEAGRHAFYVFDCLSDLANVWSADQMLGNFFVLTCPRLYVLQTVTYFAIYRNYHASFALAPITETTQFLLDVFRHQDRLYVRPIKVQHRSSEAMNAIHVWEDGDQFRPITSSAIISEILSASRWPGLRMDARQGFWRRIFGEAQEVWEDVRRGHCPVQRERDVFQRLARMVLSRDEGMLELVDRYLSLEDILTIRDRMVGIGLIGGKALGMLLARAILKHHAGELYERLETPDCFFIGADVFYTFLIRNGVWWLRQQQRNPQTFLQGIHEAQERILQGQFPSYTLDQLQAMLDYFGESPYIVRSSSLLEDAYGNAFAGKYDSVFCANQGPRERRFQALLDAIRQIYASVLSEKALRYRAQRNMLDRDEQMALLVMRVSGDRYGDKYFPLLGGVGFSFNPYVWHRDIDPRAGVVRLVFGLGTRAVDRVDDDYTRLVALNAPFRRPENNFDEVCEYSQHRADYLDLTANRLTSGNLNELIEQTPGIPLELVASRGTDQSSGSSVGLALTFEGLLKKTPFVSEMRKMLQTLENAYGTPVDIEFCLNVVHGMEPYRVNLLQCRPLQVQGSENVNPAAVVTRKEDRIIEAHGAIVGLSRLVRLDRFVYVVPRLYAELPLRRRSELSRILGRINAASPRETTAVMLLGPGRWGTSSPDLGIPVPFAEINQVSVLCEIVTMRENFIPDVSLGTHFLNELVEMNILYLAIFPQKDRDFLNEAFFLNHPNRLPDLVPNPGMWADLVRVVDAADVVPPCCCIALLADAARQEATVFVTDRGLLTPCGGSPSAEEPLEYYL